MEDISSIWSQKLCITEFYRKLNLSYWNASYRGILDAIRWSLVVSLLGVVVSIFAECNPFHTYVLSFSIYIGMFGANLIIIDTVSEITDS